MGLQLLMFFTFIKFHEIIVAEVCGRSVKFHWKYEDGENLSGYSFKMIF